MLLAAIVGVLVYLPPVQRFAVDKVSGILARDMGMYLAVDKVRVRFPVGVTLAGATLTTSVGDTLARVGHARVDMALGPLLSGRVVARNIDLENALTTWHDSVSQIVLRASVRTLSAGRLSLDPAAMSIRISGAVVDGADVGLVYDRDKTRPDTISGNPTPAWTVEADRFEMSGSRFAMDLLPAPPHSASSAPPAPSTLPADRAARFDAGRIRVDSLSCDVRGFRYADGGVSVGIDRLELVESSGLKIVSGGGDFAMTSEAYKFEGMKLTTPGSALQADLTLGTGVAKLDGSTHVSAEVSGSISLHDVGLFLPFAIPEHLRSAGGIIAVEGSLSGTLEDVSIERLAVELPGNMKLNAAGRIHGTIEPANISGEATFEATLADVDFLKELIPDTAFRRRLAIPRDLSLLGAGTFSSDTLSLAATVIPVQGGRFDANGRLGMRDKTYSATIETKDFPIGDFLPRDSLGAVSLSLEAKGHGFDFPDDMTARATLSVERLDYKTIDLGAITADLATDRGEMTARVESRSDLLTTGITLEGRIERDSMSSVSATKGSAAPMRYTLSAKIDSTTLRIADGVHRVVPAIITASASSAGSSAGMRSGDLSLDVSSPLGLDSLVNSVGSITGEVRRQLAARHFNADSLQSAFPGMELTVRAGRGNLLRDMAVMQGFDFHSVSADISTVPGTPFGIESTVIGLSTGKLTLDSLVFGAHRNADSLDYTLRMANRPGRNDNLGLIEVSGSAGGNTVSADVLQRDTDGGTGFRFGVRATLDGNTLRGEMTPANPILGYEKWAIGQGSDWVEWDTDGKLRADLRLDGPAGNEYVSLVSASLPDIPDGALRFRAAGLDIEPMLSLVPVHPPLGGVLSSDITFGFPGTEGARGRSVVAAKGSLEVDNLAWNARRVADVAADVDFQSDASGRMALDAQVVLDGSTALTAEGYYTAGDMDFSMTFPSIPLAVVEGFMPPETARLSGKLDGKMRMSGIPTSPAINGDVGITGGRATLVMSDTGFDISPDRITIADGLLALDDFGITSPGGGKLSATGRVDISNLSNPVADMNISATDFRVVDSRHLGGSQLYGTASLDADITARGALSSMTVRGDVSLSKNTDIVYILRNRSRVRDEKQHIVEFTVFADSLLTYEADTLPRIRRAGVDMLVGVEIPEGVRATLSLDELNENRVEVVGGGSLSYSMNTRGDARLVGRYTLSGGTVYYRPPVIPQKIFAVSDGSYVEWTGEAASPRFNVSATQTSEIALDYDDGSSEQVDFDISIDISGSLRAMDMRFDVAAPGNLAIQNQLLAMSDEGRMQQALTLLVYGQYTGPGVSSQKKGGFDARSTLNNFISKEVNQWARNNLSGVDLSMGIDTRNDVAGGTRTDYSYSVSKSLFNDRIKVSIGGSVADNATSQNFADNLLDDVVLEYRLTDRDNMFLKLYRSNTRESILEGEVTETGGGFMMRKKINRLKDLFRRSRTKNGK